MGPVLRQLPEIFRRDDERLESALARLPLGRHCFEFLEGLKEVQPDLVFTHTRDDLHQDHRLACDLTWNMFRSHFILDYEIPKYDGDLGSPNVFVPLEEPLVKDELFRGLMRLAGWSRRPAEASTCRKLTLVP
jgi:hypothetical protein